MLTDEQIMAIASATFGEDEGRALRCAGAIGRALAASTPAESEYAVVELLGHRRVGARVSEVQRFGATMMRAEILTDPPVAQYIGGASIYCVTPCTEAQARAVQGRYDAYIPEGAARQIPAVLPRREPVTDADYDDEFADGRDSGDLDLDHEEREALLNHARDEPAPG